MATERFSGPLGGIRDIPFRDSQGQERTAVLDIPTLIEAGLLERLLTTLERLEIKQDQILMELRKHTDALMESVGRPLEAILE